MQSEIAKEKKTVPADLFYALRNTQIKTAEAVIDCCRILMACTGILFLLASTLVAFSFIDHWMIPPLSITILLASIVVVGWVFFALPSTLDEIFEAEDEMTRKQAEWRL